MRKENILIFIFLSALIFGYFSVGGSEVLSFNPAPDPVYLFNGRGRAHGVGLCMDGVLYRAREGHSYRQILNYYYTGVQFGKTDEERPIRVLCRDGRIRVYPLRQYLYRLAEEPDTYPYEGLKVLYVAARTYALSCIERGKHSSQGFDICSSGGCCQAFNENKDISRFPNSVRAVNETAGEILTYGGHPIIAAYHGSCGGHTENNEDVWGGKPVSYLRGKPDQYCSRSPQFQWTLRLRKSEIESRLNAYSDTNIGALKAIDIVSRTPGGRVDEAYLRGSYKTVKVKGRVLSSRLGLPSALFDLPLAKFDEYILLYNSSGERNHINFIFMERDGGTSKHSIDLAGNSRFTLRVNDYLQYAEHSTFVSAERPIVCERTMYFDYGSGTGGSGCSGAPVPAKRWYFAEGYTAGGFDTYILIANPSGSLAKLRIQCFSHEGKMQACSSVLSPQSRATLRIDDLPGFSDTEVSTIVESTNGIPVVAERALYFTRGRASDGNSESGCTKPSTKWHLAEGYTGGDFDTYILLFNPGDSPAKVKAIFMREDGYRIEKSYTLRGRSRHTIDARKVPGISQMGFSTKIWSTNKVPIVVERSMYFSYRGYFGAHDGNGIASPSSKWYFAEGYTGGEFDTYFLMQNPSNEKSFVEVRFTKPSGKSVTKSLSIPPMSRLTLCADHIPEIANDEFSALIRSKNNVGIVAERAMYFRYFSAQKGREGGHLSAGVPDAGREWYFAEGYTGY